jgi:hypothetical protein
MKYFIDTEFIEGPQEKRFMGIKYGETKPTIDLISIGIVSEDSRGYYAISKDFNIDEAWNRSEIKEGKKVYWIRENVLKPIFHELGCKELGFDAEDTRKAFLANDSKLRGGRNDLRLLKRWIKKHGKSNEQIAEEIKRFCNSDYASDKEEYRGKVIQVYEGDCIEGSYYRVYPEFYGYYADYDWVVFCWLFGKMIDLPKGFPMYCVDLKQEMERLNETLGCNKDHKEGSYKIKEHKGYPKQENEHNALADAKWNKELYEFLKAL